MFRFPSLTCSICQYYKMFRSIPRRLAVGYGLYSFVYHIFLSPPETVTVPPITKPWTPPPLATDRLDPHFGYPLNLNDILASSTVFANPTHSARFLSDFASVSLYIWRSISIQLWRRIVSRARPRLHGPTGKRWTLPVTIARRSSLDSSSASMSATRWVPLPGSTRTSWLVRDAYCCTVCTVSLWNGPAFK